MQCRFRRSITFANWADNITEPDKGKDFKQGKSTFERLMKPDQTKEEKPEWSRTKEGPTGRL